MNDNESNDATMKVAGKDAGDDPRDRFRASRKAEALQAAGTFAAALGLSGGDVPALLDGTHDALVAVLPKGSKMRSVPVLAEAIVYHVLRARGVPYAAGDFSAHAPTGPMPMSHRKWLLRCTAYLGPRERLARAATPGVDPVLYMDGLAGKVPAVHVNAVALLHGCKRLLARLSPRFQAGVAVAAAFKGLARASPRDVDGWSLARVLATGTLPAASSVANACKRVDFDALVDFVAPPRGRQGRDAGATA